MVVDSPVEGQHIALCIRYRFPFACGSLVRSARLKPHADISLGSDGRPIWSMTFGCLRQPPQAALTHLLLVCCANPEDDAHGSPFCNSAAFQNCVDVLHVRLV